MYLLYQIKRHKKFAIFLISYRGVSFVTNTSFIANLSTLYNSIIYDDIKYIAKKYESVVCIPIAFLQASDIVRRRKWVRKDVFSMDDKASAKETQ